MDVTATMATGGACCPRLARCDTNVGAASALAPASVASEGGGGRAWPAVGAALGGGGASLRGVAAACASSRDPIALVAAKACAR